MSSRLTELAARRATLVARSASLRGDLQRHVRVIRGELTLVDRVVRGVRAIGRSGLPLGVVLGVMVLAGPRRFLRGLSTVLRFAPYVLGVFQLTRTAGTDPETTESPEPTPRT